MDVACTETCIELTFPDGLQARFNNLWLRDNCPSAYHPDTSERVFDILSVSENLRAKEAVIRGGHLHVAWEEDDHRSTYALDWLRAWAVPSEPTRAAMTLWDADLSVPTISHREIACGRQGVADWLARLHEYGVVLVIGGPVADDEVIRLANLIGPVRATNFGARFDVKSKPAPINNAYTAIELFPHMDLPNWDRPPDFQFLYCLTNDARGGESVLVDGFRVAEALREADPAAFTVLNTVPMSFRFHDDNTDIRCERPAIGLHDDGSLKEVRFNRAIMDTLCADVETMHAVYRAHRKFTALSRRPEFAVTLRLRPGDMMCFDNLRILHGRRAFDPNTGDRHLQGCYVDRDFVHSVMRMTAAPT